MSRQAVIIEADGPGPEGLGTIGGGSSPDGSARLVAYVVTNGEPLPSTPELIAFLRERLPEYMVPSGFVAVSAIPRTPNGKIDRGALPAPENIDSRPNNKPIKPSTPVQEVLVSIWGQILGRACVGIDDSFFALGGHSLLAIRMVSRIRDALKFNIKLQDVLSYPTPALLAGVIERSAPTGGSNIPPITHVNRDGILPLSFAQQRLWFLSQYEADHTVYNYSLRINLVGDLNLTALKGSLNELVRRHETLRTTFGCRDGQPYQVIAPASDLKVEVIDLSGLTQDECTRRMGAMAREPFDLTQGPLFKATLCVLGDKHHVLLLRMHHIVGDEWSMEVLFDQVTKDYTAFIAGHTSPLKDPRIQYADYAVWQRDHLADQIFKAQLDYWQRKLDGAPPLLEVPADRPRPTIQTFRGARRSAELSRELTDALKQLSEQRNTTLYVTLLAAFNILLSRYTARDDIVVGSPIAGRNNIEIENLFGFFVNTLVLRTDLSGAPTFNQVVDRVRETTLEAQTNQDIPFEQLVEHLQPSRDVAHSPLFQVMFALKDTTEHQLDLPGITATTEELDHGVAKYELAMSVDNRDDRLRVWVEYNTDLWNPDTIDRMLGHYGTLLSAIAADPDQSVDQLPILTDREREDLLVRPNATANDDPRLEHTLHELFQAQAKSTPQAIAAAFEGQQLTYEQLNTQANQLANYLRDHGVQPGDLIGISVQPSLRMLVALIATFKAGAAYVPMDPRYPQRRLEAVAQDAGIRMLLTEQAFADLLPGYDGEHLYIDTHWDQIAAADKTAPVIPADPNALAYVIFTSGSTGRPKGVAIQHCALVNFLVSMSDSPGFGPDDTILGLTTLSFDIAGLELLLPLIVGGRVAIVSSEVAANARGLAKAIDLHNATVVQATPATWRMLLDSNWPGRGDLKILCGGEAMPPQLVQPLLDRCGQLWNMYGPTETTIWSSIERIRSADDPITIGRPIANTQMHILDSHSRLVPVGVPGELYIAGDGLAQQYLGRDDLTSERFLKNPFAPDPNARMYKTGDLCRRLPDGRIDCMGRLDDQVKIRGFRIELSEIESALAQHSSVRQCVVVSDGQGGNCQLLAYMVLNDKPPTAEQLRTHLKQSLPEYMLPAAFVTLDAIPLTPNGKVDRKALPKHTGGQLQTGEPYTAPRGEIEKRLTDIWSDVLKRKRIGIHDNYFDLGGHSLQAVRLFAQIESVFDKSLPLATLFQGPTIAQLAGLIEHDAEATRQAQWPLVPLQPEGDAPPFFFIHGLGGDVFFLTPLAKHLAPTHPLYGLQAMGRDGNDTPDPDIPAMAARYIRVMRTVRPTGPYHLGGYSLGGLVAFEMAQQLRAAGDVVDRLVVFDTGPLPPADYQPPSLPKRAAHLLGALPYWIIDDLLRTNPSRMYHRVRGKIANWCRNYKPGRTDPATAPQADVDIQAMFGVAEMDLWRQKFINVLYNAMVEYNPQPYPGPITLIRARSGPLGYCGDHDYGWSRLVHTGIDVHVLPGAHDSILREPVVQTLAQHLKELI